MEKEELNVEEKQLVVDNEAPVIRQKLVDTASEFLKMEKITSQPDAIKKQFLEKKGLTDAEISLAFSQSQLPRDNKNMTTLAVPSHAYAFQPSYPLHFQHVPSVWSKLHATTNIIILVSGLAYGCRYLYKRYIGPFLTGIEPDSPERSIVEVQLAVMKVLQQIEATLHRINDNILEHNEKVDEEFRKNKTVHVSVNELKSELITIKSLLLNKNTVRPPPPQHQSIPQWQLKDVSNAQASNGILNLYKNDEDEMKPTQSSPEIKSISSDDMEDEDEKHVEIDE